MNNKLVLLVVGFIIGSIIGFIVANQQFQKRGNETVNAVSEELPPGHPPVDESSAATNTPTSSSTTGPLEAFGAAKKTEGKESKPTSEPVEKAYKNIQVLKGLPSDQLMVVMKSFTESLGVSCTHCHVSMSVDEADKDDKPAKQTARKMLTMVREINKGYPTAGQVTCFTCHRGSVKPAS
ncbi:MAG: c-type cytochrome [Acidobacteriota bacterium]